MITIERLFWKSVTKSTGCWKWNGTTDSNGYAAFWFLGKHVKAYRVAWEFANGPIPDGAECIRHTCDNPLCVNPAHLIPGSLAQNVADMDERGRRCVLRGENHGNAKLTRELVISLRDRVRAGESPTDLAREIGLAQPTVDQAVHGYSWKSVPNPVARKHARQ
jgi:hypothetical protein